jgi:D-sedoheptulose 7-phosphate isomerase
MNNIDNFFSKDIEIFTKSYFEYLYEIFNKISLSEIRKFTESLLEARENNAKIFFIGNGGSAATASHFANDLAFGVNDYKKPFQVISLTDNVAVLTALGNDYGYDDIFVRQLKIYAKKNDVLVGISASGNSQNLIAAFEYANVSQVKTISITGFDGGKLKEIANHGIHVPTNINEYGPAEDVHMILDHLVSSYLSRYIKNN